MPENLKPLSGAYIPPHRRQQAADTLHSNPKDGTQQSNTKVVDGHEILPMRPAKGVVKPHLPTPEATNLSLPLVRPSAYENVPWKQALPQVKSKLGQYGVRYVLFDGAKDIIVAKPADNIFGEFLGARLAQAAALKGPENVHLETHPPTDLLEYLGVPKRPVLLMSLVAGQSFEELKADDMADVRACTPRGQALLQQMGQVLAFDYFLGNQDRFSLGGLGSNNRGNLMVSGDDIVCIDNTLVSVSKLTAPRHPIMPHFTDNYQKRLDIALSAYDASRPLDAETERNLKTITEFFPPNCPVEWSNVQDHVLDGFRQGVRNVAAISQQALQKTLNDVGGDAAIPSAVQKFLRHNLMCFQKTVAAAQS